MHVPPTATAGVALLHAKPLASIHHLSICLRERLSSAEVMDTASKSGRAFFGTQTIRQCGYWPEEDVQQTEPRLLEADMHIAIQAMGSDIEGPKGRIGESVQAGLHKSPMLSAQRQITQKSKNKATF